MEAALSQEGLEGVDNLERVEGGLIKKVVDKSGGDKEKSLEDVPGWSYLFLINKCSFDYL